MQLRSNLERRNQIGRPGLSWCGRRRRSTAGGPVRGRAALGSPEFADSGPPGVNPSQAWVRAGQCTTRKPHEASDGFGEAYYGERDGEVDLCGGALRRRAGFSGARDYRLSDSTPKEPGRVVGSHRGLLVAGDVVQMGRRRGSAAGSVRWPWTGQCGGAPRLLTRREDTSGPCEGGPGVKEALRSTAAGETRRRAGLPAAAERGGGRLGVLGFGRLGCG